MGAKGVVGSKVVKNLRSRVRQRRGERQGKTGMYCAQITKSALRKANGNWKKLGKWPREKADPSEHPEVLGSSSRRGEEDGQNHGGRIMRTGMNDKAKD